MTPAQLEAYCAVCAADPECLFQHVYFDCHAGYGAGAWRDADDALVAIPIATAAITDHLHTRLVMDDDWDGTAEWNGRAWALVVWSDHNEPDETVPRQWSSKLSAYVAAHIVRLNLDLSLIEAMKKEEA